MEPPPSKSTTREILEKAAEASAGFIPLVGGAAAVLVQYVFGYGYSRRTAAWFDDLVETVNELSDREHLTLDDLRNNDVFLDAVVIATRAAESTHSQKKLAALRAGVLHSLGADAPSVDEQARFFRLVEQFTPAHLRLLALLHDPRGFYKRSGLTPKEFSFGGSKSAIVREALPEFRNDPEWLALLTNDLSSSHLLASASLMTMMTGDGLWQSSTTNLGARFISFIADETSDAEVGAGGQAP